jgi:Na+/H+-dicarboxylate symporter
MPDSFDFFSLLALLTTIGAIIVLIGLRVKRVGFTTLVLIALVVGIGIGAIFRGNLAYVEFIGQAYIQVILAIVAPLIFISILSSVTSLGSTTELRGIGLSSAFWLLLTNAIAIVLTLAIALSFSLGRGAQLDLVQSDSAGDTLVGLVKPLDQVLLSLLPSNLVGDFESNGIVPTSLRTATVASNCARSNNSLTAPRKW